MPEDLSSFEIFDIPVVAVARCHAGFIVDLVKLPQSIPQIIWIIKNPQIEIQLTPDVALRLETVLGVPAGFWNNLEAQYREKLIRVEAENAMEEDETLAKQLLYKEMAKYGWVKRAVCYCGKYAMYYSYSTDFCNHEKYRCPGAPIAAIIKE